MICTCRRVVIYIRTIQCPPVKDGIPFEFGSSQCFFFICLREFWHLSYKKTTPVQYLWTPLMVLTTLAKSISFSDGWDWEASLTVCHDKILYLSEFAYNLFSLTTWSCLWIYTIVDLCGNFGSPSILFLEDEPGVHILLLQSCSSSSHPSVVVETGWK